MVYLMPFKYFLLHSLSHLLYWKTLIPRVKTLKYFAYHLDSEFYKFYKSWTNHFWWLWLFHLWVCYKLYVDLTSAISSTDVGLYLTGCSSSRTFSVVLSGSFFGLNIRMCSLQRCCQRGYKWISCHWLPFAWKVEKSLGVMDETLPNWHFLRKNWCLQGTQFRIDGR